MQAFLEKLRAMLRDGAWLRPGEAVLVAVSGGLDSTVLLHALHRLAPGEGWRLAVAHFDHRLRPESEAEQARVAALAARLGLLFHGGAGEVRAHARRHGTSIEMAARTLRHEFLARTARALGMRKVALAHQADDQVETFFLHWMRGGGGEAISGMRPLAPSPADPEVVLVRPLLGFRRKELRAWAEANGLDWIEDPANTSPEHLRNRVRHELLPLVEAIGGSGVIERLRRSMEVVGAEAAWVREQAEAWLAGEGQPPFDQLPPALQRAVLVRALRRLGVEPTFDRVEWLRRNPDRALSVGPGRFVRRNADGRVEWTQPGLPGFLDSETTVELEGASGAAVFAGLRLRWEKQPGKPEESVWRRPPADRVFLDAAAVGARITLRHWHPGDRFQPLGMASPVRLQDLFVNARVPREERRRRVVAAGADGRIFWVEGLRPGHHVRLRPDTAETLLWSWSRQPPRAGAADSGEGSG